MTPIGNTAQDFWRRCLAGESGAGPITAFDASLFATRIAAEVKDFKPEDLIGRKEARRMDRFTQFAVVAGNEAIADANLPDDVDFKERVGVVIGTGIGGIITFWLNSEKANENGTWSKVTPFFIPMLMANAEAAHISMQHGFKGPVFSAASACASANDAISTAYNYVAYGDAVAMITGGSEATVSPLAVGGFSSMKAMTTRNDDPSRASRPFDAQRDGFLLGEGAGVLVLEEYEHAKARGAKIYCEIYGYGQSADAYDLVAVDPDGNGVRLALNRAFAKARHLAERSRLHQRARHLDADRRSGRIQSDRESLRRARLRDRRQLDQVDARPRARRRGRHRRRRDGAGGAERHHAADDQLRIPRCRVHARLRSERRSQGAGPRGAFELVWFRRPQQRHRLRQSPKVA